MQPPATSEIRRPLFVRPERQSEAAVLSPPPPAVAHCTSSPLPNCATTSADFFSVCHNRDTYEPGWAYCVSLCPAVRVV